MPQIEFLSNVLPLGAQFNEFLRVQRNLLTNMFFEVCVCLRSLLVLSHKELGSGNCTESPARNGRRNTIPVL